MWEKKNVCRILVEKTEEQLGRFGHVWYYKVKWIFKGIGWEVVDWIQLAQDMYKSGEDSRTRETLRSTKCGARVVLDKMRDCQLAKKDPQPWS
jgi:hypothetical protein